MIYLPPITTTISQSPDISKRSLSISPASAEQTQRLKGPFIVQQGHLRGIAVYEQTHLLDEPTVINQINRYL